VNDILAAAHRRGLVLISAGMYGNVIRVLVPLNISDAQLQEGLNILADAIATVAGVAATANSVS
jgi:4-aminobutyrate aminotransferase/(S)-3-amino-2-methylpropionate transaminase